MKVVHITRKEAEKIARISKVSLPTIEEHEMLLHTGAKLIHTKNKNKSRTNWLLSGYSWNDADVAAFGY